MFILRRVLVVLLISLVVMQFIRPERNENLSDHLAVFLQETNPSPNVMSTLNKACMDCHSNHTRYPWYGTIAPVSYWLNNHINEGKEHLNFSDWSKYSVKAKDHKLEEVEESLREGWMPLESYTWAHENAILTDSEKQEVLEWVAQVRGGFNQKTEEEVD